MMTLPSIQHELKLLLHSVLEPGRTLMLAEKGGTDADEIVAHPNFRLVATMNPGDDFGKRELSPALANRFTTVWVPALHDQAELTAIVTSRLTGERPQSWQYLRVVSVSVAF